MLIRFDGKRVIVASAARGIGRAITRAFAADSVIFLASDHASWITGQFLPVTGSPLA